MKKLILSLAAVCGMTTAFAQYNNTTLNQSGRAQEAFITQAGYGISASSTQNNGNGAVGSNYVSSSQSGTYQSVYTYQSGTDNDAYLTQRGQNSYSSTSQYGTTNYVSSIQSNAGGAQTSAVLYQNGTSNKVYLDQTDNQANSSSTTATVYQFNGINNLAKLSQLGDDNHVYIEQFGSNNTVQGLTGTGSFASQQGTSNSLSIVQNQSFNTVSVAQSGMSNMGRITQSN
jgi:hypothetical protein